MMFYNRLKHSVKLLIGFSRNDEPTVDVVIPPGEHMSIPDEDYIYIQP